MMPVPAAIQPLTSTPAWVCWRWVTKPNGDRDKPPVRADFPEFHASTTNPKTWAPFAIAARTVADHKADGVGYVVHGDYDRVFIDLDNCRDPLTGVIADWAMRLVELADSYTEITPSGRGLRIIGWRGHINEPIHTAYRLPGGGSGEVFYRAVRYVTVTGDRLPGTPDALADIADLTLDLLAAAGRARAAEPKASGADPQASIADIASALSMIPNTDVHWDDWVRVGLATYRASGGSEEGFSAWRDWSAKSEKFDAEDCRGRWCHFHKSPPTRIGFGSLYYMAQQAKPLWVPPRWQGQADPGESFKGKKGEEQGEQRAPASPLPLLYFNDVAANLDCADFVEGLLIDGAMSVIYGPSNCGKTFFATDLALHVAAGWEWRGRQVEQGGIIYCAMEGAHGISNRVAAFKAHHGVLAGIPFAIIPVALDLLNPDADASRVADAIEAARHRMGMPVRWCIMDTLSRALAGGNENSPEDMGALVRNGDLIRQASRSHLSWIHHSGKDQAQGARGHSLLRAATDTEIEISRADTSSPSVARVTKQRDLEIEGEFVFRLQSVDLGQNRRGKPVTSCVVLPDDGPAPKRRERLTGAAQAALTAFTEALAKPGFGKKGDGRDIPEDVSALPLGVWRAEFYARSTLDNQEAKKKAFQRGTRDLIEAGVVAVLNDLAWKVRQ